MKKGLFLGLGQLLLAILFASVAYAEFGLLLGSFKSRVNAENYVTKIVAGLGDHPCNAFVEGTEVPGKGFWYRVCLGPFLTKKDALNKKQILDSKNIAKDMIVVQTRAQTMALYGAINAAEHVSASASVSESGKPKPVSDAKKAPVEAKETKDITLTWDAQKDPEPAGYRIYYGTRSGPPYNPSPADYADEGPPPIVVKGDKTEITLHGLTPAKDYFFAITAFETSGGAESPFSNEVAAAPRTTTPESETISKPGKPLKDKDRKPQVKKQELLDIEKLMSKPVSSKPDTPSEGISVVQTSRDPAVDTHDSKLLAAGDTIEINVPGQAEMSRSYGVAPDGNIYMISLGRVRVAGLSIASLERDLAPKLRKFISKEDRVSLSVVKSERYVQIVGGVRYPGWYHVPTINTLNDLIDGAGGLLQGVKEAGIVLRRKTEDGYREIRVHEGKIVLHPDDEFIVPAPEVYQKRVDSGDLLFINVPGRGEGKEQYLQDKIYKLNQFEVDSNGYVYIPDVGHVFVQDQTTAQIKEAIAKRLPKYLSRDAKMDVSIIEKRQFVQVLGHVTNPGVYVVREGSNVQAALNVAGGAVDGAVMSDARILRKKGTLTKRLKVNLYQFIITGDPRLLTPLHENDIFFVPISPNFGNVKRTLMPWTPPPEKLEKDVKSKVRIFGAVNNPGTYEPREGMNLVDLLISAGGETDDADLSKILIIKEGVVDKVYNLQLFFNKESDEPLPEIQNGNVVYVKFRELTIFEPAEDKVFYVLGEVQRPDEYKLADNMTLLQAITLAGGFTEWADTENITIVRMVNGKQENYRYNLQHGIAGRVPERNIFIYPGDTVYVP